MFGFKKKTKERKVTEHMMAAIENAVVVCNQFDKVYSGEDTHLLDLALEITTTLESLSYKMERLQYFQRAEEEDRDERYRLY
jgi:hypothetical protein